MKNKSDNPLRFNLLDIIITIALIGVIALGGIYLLHRNNTGESVNGSVKNVTIEYVVSMDIVNEKYHGCIQPADQATDVTRAYILGDVIDVKYSESKFTALNQESGELEIFSYPDHEKVEVTFRAKAKYEGNQYNVGKAKIGVGARVQFRVPHFLGEGFCTQMKVLD